MNYDGDYRRRDSGSIPYIGNYKLSVFCPVHVHRKRSKTKGFSSSYLA